MAAPIRIKICGLTRVDEAVQAAAAGADAVGLVFASQSPRRLGVAEARAIVQGLPPFVARVGLFVDASAEEVTRVLDATGIDTVQFHGGESPEFCAAFRSRVKVLKAFRVRGPETLASLEAYRGAADAWLLDAYVAGVHGGTGARFDWGLAVQARGQGVPLILAGGLTPGNIRQAVTEVRPFAVDVSSGVESAPGRKDPWLVQALIREARAAAVALQTSELAPAPAGRSVSR